MSDVGAKDGHGLQAYRWWMSVGVATTTILTGWVLMTVKETASDMTSLKVGFERLTTTQGHQSTRLDAMDLRNNQQDEKIGDLQKQVWRMTPSAPPSAAEEQQRQRWQGR